MFADTNLINLFPVPLWVHALKPEDAAKVSENILAAMPRLRGAKPGLAPDEAWQSDNDLQDDPAFSDLLHFVREATEGVLKYLGVEYESFLVTGLWANVTPAGGPSHRSHTHPNNFLSGVYYVKTPVGGNTIIFSDPKPQTNIIAPAFGKRNAHNSRNAVWQGQNVVQAIIASVLERNVADGSWYLPTKRPPGISLGTPFM